MIKYIAVLLILSGFCLPLKAQTGSKDQFFYTASISTGLAMSTLSSVPLILRGTAGYSFAPSSCATGGFCLSPSVGVQTKITDKMDVFLAVGYEVQNLKRLKEHDDIYFHTELEETLKHHFITLKAGIVF